MAIDFLPILKNAGLSESEVKTYLAGLELGSSPVQEIAKQAGISRTSAYDAIQRLQSHGLLSVNQRGKKTLYTVEDPGHLLNYLKGKQQKFSNQVKLIEENISDLHLLAGGEKPAVKHFQGKNIIHAFFDDINRKKPDRVYELSNIADADKYFPREKANIARKDFDPVKTKFYILHIGEIDKPRATQYYKRLDDKKFGDFHGDIAVYDNTVSLASITGGLNLIIVEDKAIAETMRRMMEFLWNS